MSQEIQKWADPAMFTAEPMARDRLNRLTPKVTLLWATPDPMGAIAAACRMYEGKPTYKLSDLTNDDRKRAWEQANKTHLKAPLEFVKFHFFIEGVTRAFTHQMVRQRTAVYAQESLRFAVKENLVQEINLPPSIQEGSMEADVWESAVESIQEGYDYLIARGIPAEDARGLLPHAVTTRLNYCTDLRALADHAGNRLCTQAQFEWRIVFSQIVQAIRQYQEGHYRRAGKTNVFVEERPDWQFKMIANSEIFRPVCYKLGHCPFTAEFDRSCTIRGRVQAGRFDQIDDAEWLLDPTAARRKEEANAHD